MKRILKTATLFCAILLGSIYTNQVKAQYRDDVSYQTFYDELSPYGHWIDYPGYGYVWSPDAGADFRPYSSDGHWVWSDDYQWTWVSDYEWGWAPFHYGRWFRDNDYGWMWVPGYEWSGAWVAWRSGDDYYGWAPLRPGINISINFSLGNYYAPDDYWCFAPSRYITSPRIYNYCIDRRQNYNYMRSTTIINNFYYGNSFGFRTGPNRYDAERYCGRIESFRFRDSYRPGRSDFRNNEVSIYRPSVRHNDNDDRRFAPKSFDRFGDRTHDNRTGNNGFRQKDNNRDGNNGITRNNNDNRNGDNRFRRDDNPDPPGRIDNNLPFRRENDVRNPVENNPDYGPGKRRDFNNPQPNRDNNNGNNNPNAQPRRFDRQDNNNSGPQPRRFERQENNNPQPQRNYSPQPEPQRREQTRSFDRGNRDVNQPGPSGDKERNSRKRF